MIEPALFESDVFEMAAPIQVPPNERCVPSQDFSTQKVNVLFVDSIVTGDETFPLVSSPKETSRYKKSSTTMMMSYKRSHDMVKGLAADFYDSVIKKLFPRLNKCLDNAGDHVENKVKYRLFIQSVVFVN